MRRIDKLTVQADWASKHQDNHGNTAVDQCVHSRVKEGGLLRIVLDFTQDTR